MKIGLGCTIWARGERAGHLDGIGVYTRALYQHLHGLGQQQPGLQPACYAFGRDLPALNGRPPRPLAGRFSTAVLGSVLFNQPLARSAALAGEIDLFHAPDHMIPQIRGVPVVASVMDLIPMLHPEWIKQRLPRLKRWLFADSVRKADHLITISEYSKQDLVQHLGIDPQRISVTPLGVEPAYFERVNDRQIQTVLQRHRLQPGFFLFIGTLQPRKNLSRVMDAFLQLPEPVRRRHPLVMVGRDGWGSRELITRIRELEQQGVARWLNYLPTDEVMALLQSAGAMVFASLYEGFGLPVIEAFAAQCPVIASATTSVAEVAGEACWAVDPGDVGSIHSAMLASLQDAEARQLKVSLGLQRARQYSWDACAQQTLEVYRQVLARY